ncbi:hypothetical protein B0I35DRAFT_349977 [Stachybotrys elegans]|uniref:Rhodopsin domain-containing protein n=1 Tax=Stachybotrys elegans TaxID=80388 RepID=A0A8K0WTC7_9HYPO|nr:hypothetical protein B0I35DRAFT_349977 [Stachybotrys elegans]
MSNPPTPEQLAWMRENAGDTQVPAILISSGICLGLTLLAVAMRVVSRSLSRTRLWHDDYFLFIGCILYTLYIIAWSFSTRFGQGRHIILVTDLRAFMILSILFLYRRIFSSQQFLYALYGLAAVIIAWSLASFFSSIFHCFPIAANWDPNVEGVCHDLGRLAVTLAVLNLLIDFIMLAYPIPQVWRLQMSTDRKILVSMTFLCGGIACVVSFVRLFYADSINSTFDPSWDGVTAGILSGLEMSTGIIACCMITFRPLLQRLRRGDSTTNSDISRRRWSKMTSRRDIELSSGSQEVRGNTEHLEEYSWRVTEVRA